jgi:hypothetical protein
LDLNANAPLVRTVKLLVIAEAPLDEIVRQTGLAGEVIESWIRICFDVQSMLGTSWVRHYVIEPEQRAGNHQLATRMTLAHVLGPQFSIELLELDAGLLPAAENIFVCERSIHVTAHAALLALDQNNPKTSLAMTRIYAEFQIDLGKLDLHKQRLAERARCAREKHELQMARSAAVLQREQNRALELRLKTRQRKRRRPRPERDPLRDLSVRDADMQPVWDKIGENLARGGHASPFEHQAVNPSEPEVPLSWPLADELNTSPAEAGSAAADQTVAGEPDETPSDSIAAELIVSHAEARSAAADQTVAREPDAMPCDSIAAELMVSPAEAGPTAADQRVAHEPDATPCDCIAAEPIHRGAEAGCAPADPTVQTPHPDAASNDPISELRTCPPTEADCISWIERAHQLAFARPATTPIIQCVP